jgi:hypothetical protein
MQPSGSTLPAFGLLERNRQEIVALCRRYGVQRISVIGSALQPEWTPERDLDLVAEFQDPPPEGINRFHQFFDFHIALEELLSTKVDLIDWKAAKNPVFVESVKASAREWFAA